MLYTTSHVLSCNHALHYEPRIALTNRKNSHGHTQLYTSASTFDPTWLGNIVNLSQSGLYLKLEAVHSQPSIIISLQHQKL